LNTEELLEYFYNNYYGKKEMSYRLPLSVQIEDIWPEELELRKSKGIMLPLHSFDGKQYWYCQTDGIVKKIDSLSEKARANEAQIEEPEDNYALIDEAYYSSAIEGAYSTRQEARNLIQNRKKPKDLSEKMIINNYSALKFVLDNLDSSINESIILEIGRKLTEGTLEKGLKFGYRDGGVQVISPSQEIVYTAPDKKYIMPMMHELIAFINEPYVNPIIKAAVTHIFFVTVHPFFDGNGRTARALSYMILLKEGYQIFRNCPISGLMENERSGYYKSIQASQNIENGYDFTYFIEYYSKMLLRSIEKADEEIKNRQQLNRIITAFDDGTDNRIVKGAQWLIESDIESITADKWSKKFKVSFETARTDLMKLEKEGLLIKETVGRKIIYRK
jgi:Uncharacterized conserved protein